MNEVPPLPTQQTVETPPPPRRPRGRHKTVAKMFAIAVLTLLLLVPLVLIQSVLTERLHRRDEAIADITSTWGREQIVVGPVLVVPYRRQVKAWKDQFENGRMQRIETTETVTAKAYFMPADLKISGTLVPDVLHRGIYESVVYTTADLQLSGSFAAPSFDEWKVKQEDILWDEASVVVAISDLRGTKESLVMKWGETSIPLKPGAHLCDFSSAVSGRIGSVPQGSTSFSMKLGLNGSHGIRFAPVGQQNEAKLSSTWKDPSFSGAFLPAERQVSREGFSALWQVSYYGRSYPQQWSTDDTRGSANNTSAINESLFGVDLISVVDTYRYVERSIKYGIMFIALVFTAFFLFEVLAPLRVHPFQYTLIGAALCLFYLALLSLSEIIPFGTAYLIGAAASAVLIVFYSAKALRSLARASVIGAELTVIYAFLYVILRLQDYSLVVGTGGLFLALAIVMYATRNIDWYSRDEA